MKLRRVNAILKKQWKDTLKNKTIFIQFILFPVMALVFTTSIKSEELPPRYFLILFATMFIGMAPMTCMASVIAEEKEKHTLKALTFANVKPWEYLLGIGSCLFIMCMFGALAFGFIGKYSSGEFIRFLLILLLGIVTSLLLGAVIGIFSRNQMSATSLTIPIMMVFSFMPMISMFNQSAETVSRFLYTQQINYLVNDLSEHNFKVESFLIIGMNLFLFTSLFIGVYRKKGLSENQI